MLKLRLLRVSWASEAFVGAALRGRPSVEVVCWGGHGVPPLQFAPKCVFPLRNEGGRDQPFPSMRIPVPDFTLVLTFMLRASFR